MVLTKERPAFEITTSNSEEVQQKTSEIFVNYLDLMADCAKDSGLRENLFKNPHYYFNEFVGMNIPKSVDIVLDCEKLGWPQLFIKNEDGTTSISEGPLSLNVSADLKSGKFQETMRLGKSEEISVKIQKSLKESEAVLIIPFLARKVDALTVVNFSDGEEVVLTCC